MPSPSKGKFTAAKTPGNPKKKPTPDPRQDRALPPEVTVATSPDGTAATIWLPRGEPKGVPVRRKR